MSRFKSGAGCESGDLAPRTAEQQVREPGKEGNSQEAAGLEAGKQTQALDNPLEIFVICAQGVCSFFRTPQQRQAEEGKIRRHFKFTSTKPRLHQATVLSGNKTISWKKKEVHDLE